MMKRRFNLKMGVTPKNDKLPEILLNPFEGNEIAGKIPNFKRLKQEKYKYRSWNIKTRQLDQEKL